MVRRQVALTAYLPARAGGTDAVAASPGRRSNSSRSACGVVGALAAHGALLHPDGRGVQQLLDDAVHRELDLGARDLVEVGQPLVEAGQLAGDHVGGVRAQRGDGRRDGLRARAR